jgi:hypothetical protein
VARIRRELLPRAGFISRKLAGVDGVDFARTTSIAGMNGDKVTGPARMTRVDGTNAARSFRAGVARVELAQIVPVA